MRIGVLTSGGDTPGMNAAVRAVARCALARGWEVVGVEDGYQGLIEGRMHPLGDRSVAGILHRGGTMLGTSRSREFMTVAGRRRAVSELEKAGVCGLVVIGGGGSLAGTLTLHELGIKAIGIPATIDNDVWGTDTAIGVDTALNTALEAIDRIKDTATALRRSHIVEVMGRECGYLALVAALAGGAEAVLVPEFESDPQQILQALEVSYKRGKRHFIVVAAEGASPSAREVHEYINRAQSATTSRLTVLGYIQRGGSPTAFDRTLASRLGAEAIGSLADGVSGVMVVLRGRQTERIPLAEVAGRARRLDRDIYELAKTLTGLREEAY